MSPLDSRVDMDPFIVSGGRALSGRVRTHGAKNSALKVLAASLLAEGTSVLHNVPDIADVAAMTSVLEHLGARVRRPGAGIVAVEVPAEIGLSTPPDVVRRLRASIVVLGPLLARQRRARVALPGGCNLGSRNIDLHLSGLARMGADITYGPDFIEVVAPRLHGTRIELPYASVGATENIMLAAVRAEGRTTIVNAAREPEIGDLAGFLVACGASITGAGSSEIVIEGVDRLAPATHHVVGDRIEAGTFAVAAAITGGRVHIDGVRPESLALVLDKLAAAGAEVAETPAGVRVCGPDALRPVDIATLPFPGFPTDLQAQFLVLLSQAHGTSMLTENVFDGRFSVVGELQRLGAEIEVQHHHAIVRGHRRLRGCTVRATDLRAGAALVLAGLVADGVTVVTEPHHVDRGYHAYARRLRDLGADVTRAVHERAGADPVAAGVA